MRIALAMAVAAAGLIVFAGPSTAGPAGKPVLRPVLDAIHNAETAESVAAELAHPETAAKANAQLARSAAFLETAVHLLGKQPVNDAFFGEIRWLAYCAEGHDREFEASGYGAHKDTYEFSEGEKCKSEAVFLLSQAEDGRVESPSLATIGEDILSAFQAEDRARTAWKKGDEATARKELSQGDSALHKARSALERAIRAGAIGQTDGRSIDSNLSSASTNDVNARVFLDPKSEFHDQVIAVIERGIEQKDKAMTTLDNAVANPPTTKPGESPLSVEVTAVFIPADRATKYTAQVIDKEASSFNYEWKLRLIRIDPQGSSPPGFQSKDPNAPNYASAAFDSTCNNAQLPGGNAGTADANAANYSWLNLKDEFVWYHGDVGSYAGSQYGCDHTKMGARGHQGTVTLIVHAGVWTCRAEIFGSNLTETPELSGPANCSRG